MFGDRQARVRAHSTIEEVANEARALGQVVGHSKFNIVDFVLGPLMLRIKRSLKLKLYEEADYPVPAFVKFHKDGTGITLNVRKTVWARAKAGFDEDRFVLAHEIGHILMHSHDELAYSAAIPSVVCDLPETERTEPQANLFADLFLLPERLLAGFSCASEIADFFDVPVACAQRRFDYLQDKHRRRIGKSYMGEICPECANFTVLREGTTMECATCGTKWEC